MGQDPASNARSFKDLVKLRKLTGIENIGDNQQRIEVQTNLESSSRFRHSDYCKHGLLLVNSIRCINRNGQPMENNDYYYAWFCYTLKLIKYCRENNKPTILFSTQNSTFVQHIKRVNPDTLVVPELHENIINAVTISRQSNTVTLTFPSSDGSSSDE